jgi:hypothetical protein
MHEYFQLKGLANSMSVITVSGGKEIIYVWKSGYWKYRKIYASSNPRNA